jgi:hypothetical protein
MTQLTLYGKAGCHLCEDARTVVLAVRRRYPFDLEEIDITRDPALFARYKERIPVIKIDGEEVLELVIEATELERCIASMQP